MNNTQHKLDRQDKINPQQDQQQKTRRQQEAKKQGRKPDMLHKDLSSQVHEHERVHEQELVETRLTR
jgi:hypothetical protein